MTEWFTISNNERNAMRKPADLVQSRPWYGDAL